MPKRPLIEMPSKNEVEKKVSTSFKFEANTQNRIKTLKDSAKSFGAKKLYLDENVEVKVNDVLDDMEIELCELSGGEHQLDERLQKKKNAKDVAAEKRKIKQIENHSTSDEDQSSVLDEDEDEDAGEGEGEGENIIDAQAGLENGQASV